VSSGPLFRFVQVELPWRLGPPDGRYLLRPPGADARAGAVAVVVIATLGAPERRRLTGRRRSRDAAPEPPPAPVPTGRATIIDVARPLAGKPEAGAWLQAGGEDEVADGLAVLNRMLHAQRIAAADPDVHPVARRQTLVARIGFGPGEQVADGLWTSARELTMLEGRRRRAQALEPQARLAAILGAREPALVCAELALRARADLDHGRPREAALQLLVTLDAAVAELAGAPQAAALADRLTELRARRDPVTDAAQAALTGALSDAQREAVASALGRIESALRALAAAGA
jgi:hypothetical protein